jgi:hypothetical protein
MRRAENVVFPTPPLPLTAIFMENPFFYQVILGR